MYTKYSIGEILFHKNGFATFWEIFVDIGKHHYDKILHCIRSQALFMIDHLILPAK